MIAFALAMWALAAGLLGYLKRDRGKRRKPRPAKGKGRAIVVNLESINRVLRRVGLVLGVSTWSGRGEWQPTRLELMTARAYLRLCDPRPTPAGEVSEEIVGKVSAAVEAAKASGDYSPGPASSRRPIVYASPGPGGEWRIVTVRDAAGELDQAAGEVSKRLERGDPVRNSRGEVMGYWDGREVVAKPGRYWPGDLEAWVAQAKGDGGELDQAAGLPRPGDPWPGDADGDELDHCS